MKVLIVEDEYGVAQNLKDLLLDLEPDTQIMCILESVEEAVAWINENPKPDLGFFDIRLADGSSFEIFEKVKLTFPIIFTTAFDEFAIKAFKVNSIDYLLKPIGKEEIKFSLNKYKSLYGPGDSELNTDSKEIEKGQEQLLNVIREMKASRQSTYKKSFLVYIKDKIIPIVTSEIAYFFLQNEVVYCITLENKKYTMDQNLERIMAQLDPEEFFRANRQCIISRRTIDAASQHFNRKLLLQLSPKAPQDVFISKTRVSAFKNWLSG